jgi:predicted O-linked N-acetylglucosamine transferase (SPINDLY family)
MSAEFHEQATAHLTADLYECHDRGAFELHAFATGKNDGSPMRKRLEAAFDVFSDVSRHSDRDVAEAIRRAEIDILVNLNGYFGGERTRVFALRPAPVQVNYLGYPATMGASYIDYIIADRIVIPEESRDHYAEKIAYLPGSYQPNDRKKKHSERALARAECALPETGFVFCCFNNNFKLTPDIFGIWMRLLLKVEGSVLWLYEGNAAVRRTLVREAEARGCRGGTHYLRAVCPPSGTSGPHRPRRPVPGYASLQCPHDRERRALVRRTRADLRRVELCGSRGGKPVAAAGSS